MQKSNPVEVISKETGERIDRIKSHHDAILTHQRDANVHRFLCGLELNRQKDALKHTEFGPWCKEHLSFLSNGTAHNYMRLADTLVSKFPTVGNLTERLQITNGKPLPEKEAKPINDALSEALDGKTITQFMRSEGIIRDKKEAGGKKRNLSDEEKVDAERAAAERMVDATIEQIAVCKGTGDTEGKTLREVPVAKRRELLAATVALNKVLRKLCKKGSKK